jgi:hypothetical protein
MAFTGDVVEIAAGQLAPELLDDAPELFPFAVEFPAVHVASRKKSLFLLQS